MSGFSGFGSSPFGSSNPQQQSTFLPGSSFGASPAHQSSGFPASGGGFGAGGASSPAQPFGASTFSSPQPSFGLAVVAPAFGATSATTSNGPFSASSGFFGASASIVAPPSSSTNNHGGSSFFGSQNTPHSGFGATMPSPSNGPFGGTSFESTATSSVPLFGAPQVPAGFGSIAGNTQPFASNPKFDTLSAFGQQSAPVNPFANNQNNSQPTAPSFGASGTSGFGNVTNSSATFGGSSGVFVDTSSTSTAGNFLGYGTTNSTSAAATMTFGSTTSNNPFGTSSNTVSSPFGTSTGILAAPTVPFAASSTTAFGSSPFNQQQPLTRATPFVPISQQSATGVMSFSSSNIVASTVATGSNIFGFGNSTASNNSSSSTSQTYALFGAPSQSDLDMRASPIQANVAPSTMSPMLHIGGQTDSEDMGDDDDGAKGQFSSLPFGRPSTTTTAGAWGSSTGSNPFVMSSSAPSFVQSQVLGSIPESDATKDNVQDEVPGSLVNNDDKLSRLKAKLEQKKKRLEEKKRRDEELTQQPVESSDLSRAERNAIRFGTASVSVSTLNPSLSAPETNSDTVVTLTNREDFESAISLVGTCMKMCPDEEIERRERESDVQLLEKPMPGTMHPIGWTIHDTMVKRFRRSAADYKLDVPEWVRPPDVLESVCGYLEEWVMERDRQGPDQRFIDSPFTFDNGIPPSLDVYQFIWDRTRMVRKDFILQNYVGTGGNCDARAVRCHERIARWHAMCEHQLSHIPEFVRQQSQQNIQELGQTMKTLNQYYDDSLNRSIVEVPNDLGIETRTDLARLNHGCTQNAVQGPIPVDFDKITLHNDSSVETGNKRIIGSSLAVMSAHHGTAEPEMRGLYILLTLENDNGMEVLKYAARLYQIRPNVYQSTPVQLALNIYKSRKEYNYARFFSILRSPSTPYLFGCIMFKYVETMRKLAFRIMAKTYGGKNRENEPIYDAYPVKTLTHLLCFENDDETREACKHYNITVKDENAVECIFWRNSSFREPKDPSKGTLLRLVPWKMTKTIENKAHGVTRLGVCRGEVSGDGAVLLFETPEEKAKREELARETERISVELQKARRREEEKAHALRRSDEEEKRKALEKIRQAELEKNRFEEEQRQHELELQQRRAQEEHERIEKERQHQANERKRKDEEIQLARLQAEAAERKRLDKIRELEVIRLQVERQEEEERQKVAERMRQEVLEETRRQNEKRQIQEAEHRRREAEEVERRRIEEVRLLREESIRATREREQKEKELRRLHHEANERVNVAKKKLILLRWVKKVPQLLRISENMAQTFRQISPMSSIPFAFERVTPGEKAGKVREASETKWLLRRTLERLLRIKSSVLPGLADRILREADSSFQSYNQLKYKPTLLFKIAVVLPIATSPDSQGLCDIIRAWCNSRLHFESIQHIESDVVSIRVVFVDGQATSTSAESDAVVFVIPPPWSDNLENQNYGDDLNRMRSSVDPDVPRIVLSLTEQLQSSDASKRKESIGPLLGGSFDEVFWIENKTLDEQDLDDCLSSLNVLLARLLTSNEQKIVEQTTVEEICLQFLSEIFADKIFEEDVDTLPMQCALILQRFVDEIQKTISNDKLDHCSWPAIDFVSGGIRNEVQDYFGSGRSLPMNWMTRLNRDNLDSAINDITSKLAGSAINVVWALVQDAPYMIQSECQTLLEEKAYTTCIWNALAWNFQETENEPSMNTIYVPHGFGREVSEQLRWKMKEEWIGPKVLPVESSMETSKPLERYINEIKDINADSIVDDCSDDILVSDQSTVLNKILDISDGDAFGVHNGDINRNRVYSDAIRRSEKTRRNTKRRISTELRDSMNFTKRLKRYLTGDEVVDMIVGRTTLLASIRSAPPLTVLPLSQFDFKDTNSR